MLDGAELQKELEKQQKINDEELFKGQGKAQLRRRSPNEEILVKQIDLTEFYNTHIEPLANIFKPITLKAGICPFHNDTDPSFVINGEKKYYHCFGCGYTGNVVAVYKQLQLNYHKRTITTKEAIKELGVLYAIKLLEEDENAQITDKFALARKLLTNTRANNEFIGSITLAQYKNNNKTVLNSALPFDKVAQQLGELDLILTVYLEE